MIKRVFAISLLFCSLLHLINCSKDRNTIKIGLIAGLTGRLSEIGIKSRNGASLAVKRYNSTGGINGKKIKLIVKDHKYNPEICNRVIQELKAEGVTIIIGPQLSKMAQPALDATKGKDMLIVSPVVTTDEIKDLDDNFIRLMPVAYNQGVQLAKFAINDNKNRISIIYDSFNRAYTEAVYRGFKNTFKGKNRKIIFVDPMKEKSLESFSKRANQIKRIGSDGVVMICSSIDTATLAQQLWKDKTSIKKYGAAWASLNDVITQGAKAVEGMVFVSSYKGNKEAPAFKSFKNEYEEYYKQSVNFICEYSFEAVMVLKEAISKVKTTDSNMIKKYIINKSKFQGLRDTIIINKYGDTSRKHSFTIIQNGKFKLFN